MRACVRGAYGVEAAETPPPRPVGCALRGAGGGGFRSGGVAPPRRRVPLLPVAAAKRRQWRLPCLPAPQPAVPGTLPSSDSGATVLLGSPRVVKPGSSTISLRSLLFNALLLFLCPPLLFLRAVEQASGCAQKCNRCRGFRCSSECRIPCSVLSPFLRSRQLSGHFAEFVMVCRAVGASSGRSSGSRRRRATSSAAATPPSNSPVRVPRDMVISFCLRYRSAVVEELIDAARVIGVKLSTKAHIVFPLYGSIDAEAVTKSDRYLMIATSGGLNQQRTGVRTITSDALIS